MQLLITYSISTNKNNNSCTDTKFCIIIAKSKRNSIELTMSAFYSQAFNPLNLDWNQQSKLDGWALMSCKVLCIHSFPTFPYIQLKNTPLIYNIINAIYSNGYFNVSLFFKLYFHHKTFTETFLFNIRVDWKIELF